MTYQKNASNFTNWQQIAVFKIKDKNFEIFSSKNSSNQCLSNINSTDTCFLMAKNGDIKQRIYQNHNKSRQFLSTQTRLFKQKTPIFFLISSKNRFLLSLDLRGLPFLFPFVLVWFFLLRASKSYFMTEEDEGAEKERVSGDLWYGNAEEPR